MKRLIAMLGFLCGWLIVFPEAVSAQPQNFISFAQFLSEVEHVDLDAILTKGARVQGKVELEKMRLHILSLYEGVDVVHSFALDEQIFDCLPIDQQPSVRHRGLHAAAMSPPPLSTVAGNTDGVVPNPDVEKAASPLTLGLQDRFGNSVRCEEGSIPFRRVTLDEMARFKNLEGFFRKTPWSEGGPLDDDQSKAASGHKYAYGYQSVKNYGGNSWLNLWSPSVNTSAGQVFSLAQQWYVGGRGKALQTVEGGWQVYPVKYRTNKAVVFIFWTADNYNKTGCYNLDCAGFVQTNSKWALGGTWTNYSTRGGTQWQFQMQWQLVAGRWWLYLQGNGDFEAVGYYPTSIFNSGQLSRYADLAEYGGETVGTSSWPPMGSGAFPSAGSGQAAYQSRIFYIKVPNIGNGGIWANLTVAQPSSKCYRLLYTPSSLGGEEFGTYFYFGGPGGKAC